MQMKSECFFTQVFKQQRLEEQNIKNI